MFKKEIAALLLALTAASSHAAFGSEPGASASVASSVVPNGTTWTYSYTLTNTDDCIGNCETTSGGKPILGYWLGDRTFALPFYGDAQIVDITAPEGWAFAVTADGPFEDINAGTLVWYSTSDTSRVGVSQSLSGFGFTAGFAPGAAEFYVENGMREFNGTLEVFYGAVDIPMSPLAVQALTPVPEPSTYALLLLGTVTVGLASARRRKVATKTA